MKDNEIEVIFNSVMSKHIQNLINNHEIKGIVKYKDVFIEDITNFYDYFLEYARSCVMRVFNAYDDYNPTLYDTYNFIKTRSGGNIMRELLGEYYQDLVSYLAGESNKNIPKYMTIYEKYGF